ncbi:ABC transporter B family member 21 isoform X1 [Ricinus communis]|uniref:Multidrug resistance protein 1, 2, putative n=1 Tax=Ricinus communis TaxID=3988 RepID=B9S017_RICCO|nr:ABC transporter B family member 21 isoform X1 [Ricinus communis]XP_025013136.1 ABC transporter B family member 21 isoform X1 [Ricinus communis]XP_048235306.1 ABC transporter B family member 21 isoform X1 [Ricinus communis]EEF43200.1 multidrug resistance protein 1, 2, putative [Ricinus communis]|eukprot:XP_002519336.1 ABC transporter B family member 21 isoform X1 [Ricinus communis]
MADESNWSEHMNKEETTAHSSVSEGEKIPEYMSNQQDTEKVNDKEKDIHTVPYYKLFSFADSLDILLITIGTVAAFGNGICMPLMTILLGELIDSIGKSASTSTVAHNVAQVSLKFIYLALGSGFASFFQVACWMITGERQAARIRSLYLKAVLRQDISFFDKEANTGEVVGRMSGDTILIQDAMGEKVGNFIQLLASFVGGFLVAFLKGWLLTLVMLSLIPPIVLSGAIMNKLVGKLASRGQTSYTVAANILEQTIGSIRTVASFTGEKHAVVRYNKSLSRAYDSGVQEGLAAGVGFGTLMFILLCSYGFAVWFGGRMVLEKGYTGGNVLNVIFSLLTGSLSLGQASPCINAFAAGQAAAVKIFEAINRKPEIDAYDTKGLKLEEIHGDIELRNVYFSYPSRPHEQIFCGFCLSVPSGTTTALVGHSGSGKSTVISLIERFYDPQAGEVLIDGVNLKEFQLKWIRKNIGLVSQEPLLFTSSIRENIAYGKEGATMEEIRAAADLANAANVINMLPKGLDTMVGEHGIQLSGGQKQRIAIARAVLKNPRILILDEATSALDAESERMVQVALDRVMINRTTLMVAHRLSTVRNANMIAVMQKGKIVQKGTLSDLLKDPNGAYAQLIQYQEFVEPVQNVLKSPGSSHHSIWASVGTSPRVSLSEQAAPEPLSTTSSETSKMPLENPLRRLALLSSPEIPVLLVGAVAAVVNGIIMPIFGLLLANIIKTYYEKEDQLRKDSRFWALIFVLVGLVSLVTTPMSTYFFSVAGCRLIKRIRLMFFEKVVNMEIAWFDEPEHSSGAIGASLSADAAAMRGLVGDTFALLIQNTATGIAGLVIAFHANWQIALVILVLLPLMGLSGYVQLKSMKGFNANAKKMYEKASQVASDAVSSIRTVASFCAEEKVMQLYQKNCDGPLKAGKMRALISGIGFGLSFFFLFFFYAVSFYVGAHLVDHGKATFTEVFRVFFALSMAALGISQSNSLAPDANKARSSAASIFTILDQKSKIDPSDPSGTIIENLKGEIEFRHVGFQYPLRPDIQIFQDFSLAIQSGKIVALVGESGSGKSTVIALLQRFYNPDSGKITLDGIEIQRLRLKWLRQQMGLVSQEPVLFNDSIRANIAYGREANATEAEIMAAAELANAHCFISSLKQGYDTIVGERGVQLSGGQKQRVAIARAIVKAPRILLLDEATSALDAESERGVQDALERVMVGRTTLVIAHRLSTIKCADKIAVLKNGEIVEKGKHKTLINIKNGIYASLMAPQSTASS